MQDGQSLSYAYPEVLSYNGNPYPATYPACLVLRPEGTCSAAWAVLRYDTLQPRLPCPLIHWLLYGLKQKFIHTSLASLDSA